MGTSSKLGVARRSFTAWLNGFSAATFAIFFSRTIRSAIVSQGFRVSQNATLHLHRNCYGFRAIQQEAALQRDARARRQTRARRAAPLCGAEASRVAFALRFPAGNGRR